MLAVTDVREALLVDDEIDEHDYVECEGDEEVEAVFVRLGLEAELIEEVIEPAEIIDAHEVVVDDDEVVVQYLPQYVDENEVME